MVRALSVGVRSDAAWFAEGPTDSPNSVDLQFVIIHTRRPSVCSTHCSVLVHCQAPSSSVARCRSLAGFHSSRLTCVTVPLHNMGGDKILDQVGVHCRHVRSVQGQRVSSSARGGRAKP